MTGWIVETLVASTLLMLLVLALRGPVRRAFGAPVAYALWALPVLRMCLPPLPGQWHLSALVAPLVEATNHAGVVFGALNPDRLPPEVGHHAIATIELALAEAPIRVALVPPVEVATGPSWLTLAIGLWVLGALCFLGFQLLAHRCFCRRIEQGARRRSAAAGRHVDVIETDAATGPLAYGIWRKRVAFPSDFAERYAQDERDLALAHELAHHARGDLVANWVALVVLALHWFNPVAWRAFRAYRADQEMACDAQVLAGRDPALRHAYGRAIAKSAHGAAISAACHLHTVNDLKGRLRMLTKATESRARRLAGGVATTALIAAGLVATASGSATAATSAAPEAASVVAAAAMADLPSMPTPPAPPTPPREPARVDVEPLPPSAVPPADLPPPPPAPPTPTDPDIVDPPVPPVPPMPPLPPEASESAAPARSVSRHIITRGYYPVAAVPQVTSQDCRDGNDRQFVRHEIVDGRRRIIICQNRIRQATKVAQQRAVDAEQMRRDAQRHALDGLRRSRDRLTANPRITGEARASALWAIDRSIAQLEADVSRD